MNDYLENRVMTASREMLHLMVVDGALRHCESAREAVTEKDREWAWRAFSAARAHVVELIGGVAPDDNEVCANMRSLFQFVYRELMHAETEHSIERIDSAVRVLNVHRETWAMLMEQLASQSSGNATSATSIGA